MKKMTMMDSSNIIGGTYSCKAATFEKATIGGVDICTAVKECTNKFGQPTTLRFPVPESSCAATDTVA